MKTKNGIFWQNNEQSLFAKSPSKVSPCIWKKEKFLYNYFGHKILLWWQKRTTFRRIGVTMNRNLVKSDVVKHELQVESKHELKFKSTNLGNTLLPGTVSYSKLHQWWFIRQMLLICFSSLPASASPPPWLPQQTAIFRVI